MSLRIELKKLLDRRLGRPLLAALTRGRHPAAAAPPTQPRSILVIKLWGFGNLAMVLPCADALRRRFPDARIDLLTLASNATFARSADVFHEVLTFDPGGTIGVALRLSRLSRQLREREYDLVVDFEQFLTTSAILVALARPRFAVGFETPGQHRHLAYDLAVPYREDRHMSRIFQGLVAAVGADVQGPAPLRVPRCVDAAARVDALLRAWPIGARPLVVLHAGSGDHFEGRRWPLDHFARLADDLVRERNAFVVLTGGRSERTLVTELSRKIGAPHRSVAGLFSILDLIEFLARADLVVSNDTAPVHLASALGRRVIGLYGPNQPRLYGPLSQGSRAFYLGLGCSPCITNSNAKTSLCRVPLCMRAISPALVASAALAALDEPVAAGIHAP
ncbi:MAG: glycosyltransferase family 9 protein [Planctomycetes bacterium]|nr:glycosyltransferase family 9 protein [Planctomycetota bacterium]